MSWRKWLGKKVASAPGTDVLRERLKEPTRWPGDRLPALLLACGSDDPELAAAAAAEIRATLPTLRPEWLIRIDAWMRHELWGAYDLPRWVSADVPPAVDHLRSRVGDDVAVLCLLSMAPSGFVREAAIARIAALGGDGGELPFLLLRSYDWVFQVRRAAERAALARLTPEKLPRLVECLGLFVRTEARERGGDVGRRARELLRDPAARPLLRLAMQSGDAPARLFSFQQLAAVEGERPALVRQALASSDPVLRRAAARMAEDLPGAEHATLAPVLLADRSAHLRTQGVLLAGTLGGEVRPLLRAAAADANATVRLFARQALRERGETIDAAWYRAELAARPDSPGALAGLAEMGTREDAELFERYLAAPRVRLRAIAVQGLARVRKADAVPALVRALAGPSPRVSRAAANELRTLPVSAAELVPLFGSGVGQVRRNALSLLTRRGKWEALIWILRARVDADPKIAAVGGGMLQRWILRFNRSHADPTTEQAREVKEALAASAGRVPEEDRKRLMGLLPRSMRITE